MSLRVRIGVTGLVLTLGIVALGYLSASGHFHNPQVPWTAAAATCAVATLVWFRSSGTLDCVESELLRTVDAAHSWKDARKIVDSNAVAMAWNNLLDHATNVPELAEPSPDGCCTCASAAAGWPDEPVMAKG